MSEEKIYQYNKLWLEDKAKVGFLDSLRGSLSSPAGKKSLPEYAKGSLIPPTESISLKKAMKEKKVFDINPYLSKFSNFAIPVDLIRYKNCEKSSLGGRMYTVSRPIISFLTTTDRAKKLKYLSQQRPRFDYMYVNYKDVKKFKNVETFDQIGGERVRLPSKTIYKRSKTFDRYVIKVNSTGEKTLPMDKGKGFLRIPHRVELGDDYVPKIRTMEAYDIRTEEEYENLFLDFSENVNRKVNERVNLDDWSFCIVFYRKWCDKKVGSSVKKLSAVLASGDADSMLFYPEPKQRYGPSDLFNMELTGRDTEFNMLNFIENSFRGEEVKEPILKTNGSPEHCLSSQIG